MAIAFSRKAPQSVYQKYLSWFTLRQTRNKGTKGNTVFLRKKKLHKRENGFTVNTQKYHITWWIVLWNNRLILQESSQLVKFKGAEFTYDNNFFKFQSKITGPKFEDFCSRTKLIFKTIFLFHAFIICVRKDSWNYCS